MRILSAFFAVLFTFINPCMLYKVVSELEYSFSHNLPEKIRSRFLEIICTYFIDNNLASKLRLVVYMSVLLFTLLHLIATSLCLYGHYSCRPAFFRPFLVDAALSFFMLLLFECFSLLIYLQLNSDGSTEEKDFMRTQLRNVYVSAGFLLAYMAWLAISAAAYTDTKMLHADFMHWIAEEKSVSMRSKAYASSEKSDRSSKGSKISNRSATSYRSRASNRSDRSNRSFKSECFFAEDAPSKYSPVDV